MKVYDCAAKTAVTHPNFFAIALRQPYAQDPSAVYAKLDAIFLTTGGVANSKLSASCKQVAVLQGQPGSDEDSRNRPDKDIDKLLDRETAWEH